MNKTLQKLLPFIFICILGKPLTAQDYLVDYTFLGTYSKLTLSIIFQQQVDYGVDLYKVHYKTPDVNGQEDTASGLFVIPQVSEGTLVPIVVYEHGTTSGPEDVPSRLKGGYEVAMAYAAFGFATFAPDFLGLGDSRGFHPYVHAATEASASLDMLLAGYEYLEFYDNAEIDPNFLFLSGYSQGGHASMALHKEIEDFWSIIIPVTAATHMSGPYSLSGVMRDKILGDEPYGSPSYLAYIVLGYDQVYDLYTDLSEVFKAPYVTSIESFYNGSINLDVLNAELASQLIVSGHTLVREMLQDSLLDAILANPDHPFNEALRDNDRFEWTPSSPTRLYYCGQDEQVPIENALVTETTMQGLGATDVLAVNINPNFNHGACVLPAVTSSIQFFLSFVNGTGLEDLDLKSDELKIFPNPSFDDVNINWEPALNGFDYQVMDVHGVLVQQGTSSSGRLSLSKLAGGLYMVICTADGQTKMGRILRQ